MNMRLIAFALVLVSVLFAVPLRAADALVPCRPGAKVFYVNGVFKPNAMTVAADADELWLNIAHFSVTCVADVDYLYNPSSWLLIDGLVESAVQKASELAIGFGNAFLEVYFAAFGRVSSLSLADQDQIRAQVATLIQRTTLN